MNNRLMLTPSMFYEVANILEVQAEEIENAVKSIYESANRLAVLSDEGIQSYYSRIQELVPQSTRFVETVREMSSWLRRRGREFEPIGDDDVENLRKLGLKKLYD